MYNLIGYKWKKDIYQRRLASQLLSSWKSSAEIKTWLSRVKNWLFNLKRWGSLVTRTRNCWVCKYYDMPIHRSTLCYWKIKQVLICLPSIDKNSRTELKSDCIWEHSSRYTHKCPRIVSNIQGMQIKPGHALLHSGPIILLNKKQETCIVRLSVNSEWVYINATPWDKHSGRKGRYVLDRIRGS